jgi:hypothetical protein
MAIDLYEVCGRHDALRPQRIKGRHGDYLRAIWRDASLVGIGRQVETSVAVAFSYRHPKITMLGIPWFDLGNRIEAEDMQHRFEGLPPWIDAAAGADIEKNKRAVECSGSGNEACRVTAAHW